MQPSAEALAWQQRADDWAQQADSDQSNAVEPANRWSEVASTGRTAFPADGVGWRSETAEWRATGARWRQTTEWRSTTGSHGWRSTTEAWQTGGNSNYPPQAETPTSQPALSSTAWTPPGSDQVGSTTGDNGSRPSWQQFTSPSSESEPSTSWQTQDWQTQDPSTSWQTQEPSTPSWQQEGSSWQQEAPSWQQEQPAPSWQQEQATPSWQQEQPASTWQQEQPASTWQQEPSTPSWQQPAPRQPAESQPSWQQLVDNGGTPDPPSWGSNGRPAWQRDAIEGTATWNDTSGARSASHAGRQDSESISSWLRMEDPAQQQQTPGWQSSRDDGRHMVREDDRAAWRRGTEPGDGSPPAGRRRAPDGGARNFGGTGWTGRPESDGWAGHTDTGNIQMYPNGSAAAEAPTWNQGQSRHGADATGRHDSASTGRRALSATPYETPPPTQYDTPGRTTPFDTPGANPYDTGTRANPYDAANRANPYGAGNGANPYDTGVRANPYGAGNGANPYDAGNGANPYDAGNGANPYDAGNRANPYDTGVRANPYDAGTRPNPYGNGNQANPYGNGSQPNPYDTGTRTNPYDAGTGTPPYDAPGRGAYEARRNPYETPGQANPYPAYDAGPRQEPPSRHATPPDEPPRRNRHDAAARPLPVTDYGAPATGASAAVPLPIRYDGASRPASAPAAPPPPTTPRRGRYADDVPANGEPASGSFGVGAAYPLPAAPTSGFGRRRSRDEPDRGSAEMPRTLGEPSRDPDLNRGTPPRAPEMPRSLAEPPARGRRGLDRVPERGPERGLDRGPDRNHDRGMDRGQDRPDRHHDRGMDRGQDRPDRHHDRGMDRGQDRPDRSPDRGVAAPQGRVARRHTEDRTVGSPSAPGGRRTRGDLPRSPSKGKARYGGGGDDWREQTGSWAAEPDTSSWVRDPDTGQWSRSEDDPRVEAWRAEAARREAGGRRALPAGPSAAEPAPGPRRQPDSDDDWRTPPRGGGGFSGSASAPRSSTPYGNGQRRELPSGRARLDPDEGGEYDDDPPYDDGPDDDYGPPRGGGGFGGPRGGGGGGGGAAYGPRDDGYGGRGGAPPRGGGDPYGGGGGGGGGGRRRGTAYGSAQVSAVPSTGSAVVPYNADAVNGDGPSTGGLRRAAADLGYEPAVSPEARSPAVAEKPSRALPAGPSAPPAEQPSWTLSGSGGGSGGQPDKASWGLGGPGAPQQPDKSSWGLGGSAGDQPSWTLGGPDAQQEEQSWTLGGPKATGRARPDPSSWGLDGSDAAKGAAVYRESGGADWRRDLSDESDLADGESRRFGTADYMPFRSSGSAAVPQASNLSNTATSLLAPAAPQRESWARASGAYPSLTGAYERRPVAGGFPMSRRSDLLDPDDEEDDQGSGGPLAAVGYTVIWYGVPIVLFVLYMLVVNTGSRAQALSTLASAAPQFLISLVLSVLVAIGIRKVSGTWKAISVGLAAAVVGGGLATVLSSAITGNSLS